MKYLFLGLLILFSVYTEVEVARFFSPQEMFVSALVGGVSGFIWEVCKFICAKYEKNTIDLPVVIIVLIVLGVACALAYFNYEIGAKSALLALYSGFLVSEICADLGSKISKKDKQ